MPLCQQILHPLRGVTIDTHGDVALDKALADFTAFQYEMRG